jgi:hypothetical protein
MPASAISAIPDELILSFEYGTDTAGIDYVDMWDNHVIGWAVDAAIPPASEACPIIIGALPPVFTGLAAKPPGPGNSPPQYPQWAMVRGAQIVVPDLWRGDLSSFWDYISQIGRMLRGSFVDARVSNTWTAWSLANPSKLWAGPPLAALMAPAA